MLKITVITVNLNNFSGLNRTIQSVINQTYANKEYIVIDGGSNDGSKALIESYSGKIQYWISEPDSGIYHAMNKGLNKSNGDYCLFLNSGDFLISPNVLSECTNQDFKEDIVTCNCEISEGCKTVFKVIPPEDITLRKIISNSIPHQATFISRSLFEKFGSYNEKYKIQADLELFIRFLILNNCSYIHLNITSTNYNLNGISNKPEFRTTSQDEKRNVLNSCLPKRILEDYNLWEEENELTRIINWLINKHKLSRLFILYFKTLKFAAQCFKH